MIRVLICDDAVAFATLLRHWLATCSDIEVVGSVRSGSEALEAAASTDADVIVLDHVLYDVDGGSPTLVPWLREVAPELRVVLVSAMPADKLAVIARRVGADGFASKASQPETLCDAVRAAVERRRSAGVAEPAV